MRYVKCYDCTVKIALVAIELLVYWLNLCGFRRILVLNLKF